jgi:hypothetical protein
MSIQLEVDVKNDSTRHLNVPLRDSILRSPAVPRSELAGRQQYDFSQSAIDVRLEGKIGGQPLGLGRIDASVLIAKDHSYDRRLAIFVVGNDFQRQGRLHVEQHRRFAAKAEILVALLDVEANCRFALSRFMAVDQGDRVLDPQAAELVGHGGRIHHFHGEKAVFAAGRVLIFSQLGLLLPLEAQLGDPRIHRPGLGAGDFQPFGDRRFIDHLDEHRQVPGLLQLGPGRAAEHLDARLGIDGDNEQHVRIEQ